MKNFLLIILTFAAITGAAWSQPQAEDVKYDRSSIYPLLVSHPKTKFASQIEYVYLSLPTPDKYENHALKVRRVGAPRERWADVEEIAAFLDRNRVARRMVAKWFNRDENGLFNADLVMHRSYYNASMLDVYNARMTARGITSLADDSEEGLIGKTFVMVSDIIYIDKEKQAQTASTILSIIGALAGAVAVTATEAAAKDTSSARKDAENTAAIAAGISATAEIAALVAANLEGFTVKVKTHLFQLDWDEEIQNTFYDKYWVDESYPEEERIRRKELFDKSDLFSLKYLGSYVDKSEKTVFKGLYSKEDIIKKVCARAIDRSIVGLQKKFNVFKIKTPVLSVDGKTVTASIGMKEGVTPKTKFEVLQITQKDNGKIAYRRVATLKPVKQQIWDNRFMAYEEQAAGSDLTATSFQLTGKGNLAPGMLIRQIK